MRSTTSRQRFGLLLAVLAFACRGPSQPAFVQLAEARRLVDEIRVDLTKASDASDRAVLADTDEASAQFANQARQAADAVAATLPLLEARTSGPDAGRVAQFRTQFQRYRQADDEILALAVENTNLKAQRLSFGPVRQAADQVVAALDAAVAAAAPNQRCQAQALVAQAERAVREIQVLQAPHIAESSDAEMDRLEAQMTARRSAARAALERLSEAAPPALRPHLGTARAAMDRFDALAAQLIALSRRNTNVRSLALALRQKPALTAACDDTLAGLADALAKEGFSGTR
ncbi:MAG: hypothetical protein ABUS79_12160 [Pseudomonadota bacterium]